ncbi:MAG: DoxX family protein [Flavobacteriaceae bacterium]|nr:DoxX family protein [Flavobacteriaceae bacterium]
MNGKILLYWLSTLGLCCLMLFSAQMYLFNFDVAAGFFERFGFPVEIIIPLAIAKLLAIFAILWNKVKWLKEWAYAGLFFDLVLATYAHATAKEFAVFAVPGLVLLIISYALGKKVRP